MWRRDGRELFYVTSDRALVAVQVARDGGGLSLGQPRTLFRDPTLRLASIGPAKPFAATPDRHRSSPIVVETAARR